MFTSSEKGEFKCCSTEDFIEEITDYQKSYKVYDIFGKRIDKSFSIWDGDVVRIYGVITDVGDDWGNGLKYPVIDMYYADFIRKWRHEPELEKTIDDITKERIKQKIEENERVREENEYYNTLNSDYTGQTKNVDNMEQLSPKEFKECCDMMNYYNLSSGDEDLNNRCVKIKLQLSTTHKKFRDEVAKIKHLGELYNKYASINENVWISYLYCERVGDYSSNSIYTYFSDRSGYDWSKLKKKQEITVYGVLFDFETSEYGKDFKFLVLYME